MTAGALAHGLAWCCCAGTAFLALACGVGVLVMRDPWQRLHFSAPPATLGAALLALAIALEAGPKAALKPVLVLLLLTAQNGVVTHALARAVWIRRRGPFPPEEP